MEGVGSKRSVQLPLHQTGGGADKTTGVAAPFVEAVRILRHTGNTGPLDELMDQRVDPRPFVGPHKAATELAQGHLATTHAVNGYLEAWQRDPPIQ